MSPDLRRQRIGGWLSWRMGRNQDFGKNRGGNLSDQGFTLIELLVTVTILPLVIGAISVGLIAIFSLQSSVGSRLSNSGDAQMVSSTYLKDVQSSAMVTTQAASTPQCGAGTQLLGLQWDNGQTVVSYSSIQVPNGSSFTYSLVRDYCTLGNTASPSETSTVSYGLSASQGPPIINCSPTVSTCAASTQWISTAGVSSVALAISEPGSNFSYSLTATPRAWTSASGGMAGGGVPFAPFTLLDPTSCNALRVGQGTLSVNVGAGTGNGILSIASTCPGAVTVSNGGTLAASSVITADQSLNTIATNAQATYPSNEYYSTQLSNPFASLAPPAIPAGPSASCTYTQTTDASGNQYLTYTCPPGVYNSPPTFSGTNTVTINFSDAGTYYFPQGLVIPNNVTVNFASGTYIFDGTTALSTGSNVTMNGSSLLFYIGSGAATFGNNGTISMSALSEYDNIAIWDAVPSGTITIGDNSNVSSNASIQGGIYMPQGSLTTGSNVTIAASFIVADTATFGNNLNLTITSP